MSDSDSGQQNPIGKLPKWAQWLIFLVALLLGMLTVQYAKNMRGSPEEEATETAKPAPAASFTYAEGDALLREIERAFDENTSTLLKERSEYPKRGKYIANLVQRAKNLYGDVLSDYGACTKAAMAAQFVWSELVQIKVAETHGRTIETVPTITGIADFAYQGGGYGGQCRRLIEALDTQPPPKK